MHPKHFPHYNTNLWRFCLILKKIRSKKGPNNWLCKLSPFTSRKSKNFCCLLTLDRGKCTMFKIYTYYSSNNFQFKSSVEKILQTFASNLFTSWLRKICSFVYKKFYLNTLTCLPKTHMQSHLSKSLCIRNLTFHSNVLFYETNLCYVYYTP